MILNFLKINDENPIEIRIVKLLIFLLNINEKFGQLDNFSFELQKYSQQNLYK